MTKLQFRVLYREFLFRLVDRELLSVSAQGDVSKLLGRLAAVLILVSIPFTPPMIRLGDSSLPQEAKLMSAWDTEHALVAITMLIVGLFAVLSWDSAYPDRRDAFVLAPLPVRASTILLAKIASLAVALGLTVAIFHAIPGLLLPFALAPRGATPLDLLLSLAFYRLLIAYWVTMLAAGAFVFCGVLMVQGLAAQLPQRWFLRVSALLQLTAFCMFLIGYFAEPSPVSPQALAAAHNQQTLLWWPSYWFLGLFQQLNGSLEGSARPTLMMLARRAWISLGGVSLMASLVFVLSYFRTIRKIVEQPDLVPGSRRFHGLPRFGPPLPTAITQFSIRSLLRSRQHRMLLSFYLGSGFALVILFLKTPVAQQLSAASARDPWHQVSVPLLASSFVLLCAWILGTRVVFAIPFELRANWIFRITQVQPATAYFAGSRRAAYILALAPVWCASAVLFFSLWPCWQALGHLTVLILLGVTITELGLGRFHKIPFACSYLPGKSNLHITFLLCLMLGLNAIFWSAEFERRALSNRSKYWWVVVSLSTAALFAWRRRTRTDEEEVELHFQEELPPVITSLGL